VEFVRRRFFDSSGKCLDCRKHFFVFLVECHGVVPRSVFVVRNDW
jgi:hypothetical protein